MLMGRERGGSVLYGRGQLVGHIVDPRNGVIFNAWRPHFPLLWRGKRYAIVMYTGVAWDKVPADLQRRIHELTLRLLTQFLHSGAFYLVFLPFVRATLHASR